jgi:DNA (cytosine-5)-methyltransferase 1
MFDYLYDNFKIDKPVRLIEMFAGYGSQSFALKYLGVPFEHWRICEWAVPSIQAYKDAHFTNESEDHSRYFTKEYIIEFLHNRGISMDYNVPMTLEQIKRLKEEQLRTIYNNIIATNNLVNIQKVKGERLDIVDQDKYTYVLTYSFPCQDLSLAGKGAGMSRNSGTRSGMLWEVERILDECNLLNCLPQVLLMENVPQVIGQNNLKDFISWRGKLESLGYSNYVQILNAKDYGIPQNRQRCFMVSILGDYNYNFPKKIPLELRLKDMLEKNVDEKYYLSDKQLSQISNWNSYQNPLDNVLGTESICEELKNEKNFKNINKHLKETLEKNDLSQVEDVSFIDGYNRNIKNNGITGTISTRIDASNDSYIAIKEATKKGYTEAYEGDGIDISGRMETHRGTVQKGMCQTLKTSIDVGVVVKDEYVGTYEYAKSDNFMQGKDRLFQNKDISGTLLASGNHNGVVIANEPRVLGGVGEKLSNGGTQWYQQDRIYDDNVAISVTTSFNPYYKSDLRIRKLTPKECFRLMGVKDEDYENIAKNQSNSKLYHLAGDSIVVNVLMGIFKEMM